ncbi:hypothetical protein DFH09DRAFT_1413151 [Mycena vulgaris]|nr:hypothetical protein DFH09DRAFT_1413151 [Mycena vulgaris]
MNLFAILLACALLATGAPVLPENAIREVGFKRASPVGAAAVPILVAFGTVVRPHTADSELPRARRIPREAPHCRSLTLAARGAAVGAAPASVGLGGNISTAGSNISTASRDFSDRVSNTDIGQTRKLLFPSTSPSEYFCFQVQMCLANEWYQK